MNEVEKAQCMRLLVRVPYEELRSLQDTVTQKQISSETIEETICVIVDRSNSAKELLSRKRLKVQYLFKYLYVDAGIVISSKARKDDQIERILNYWGELAAKDMHANPKHVKNIETETPKPAKKVQHDSKDVKDTGTEISKPAKKVQKNVKKKAGRKNKGQLLQPSVLLQFIVLLFCILYYIFAYSHK